MRSLLLSILIVILATGICFAETNNDDSNSIDQKIFIKLFYDIPALFLDFEYEANNKKKYISYSPNCGNSIGVAFSYRGIGLAIKESGYNKQSEVDYGNTKATDLQLFYYGDKFGVDFYYQNYKGFHLMDPEDYSYNVGDPQTIRSDLKMVTYGLNFYYSIIDISNVQKKTIFSRYSLANSFEQLQKHDSGISVSILLMASLLYFNFDSDYELIPPSHQMYFDKYSNLTGGTFQSMGLSPGVAVSLFPYRIFINIMVFVGSGVMKKTYVTTDSRENEINPYKKINARFNIGYNGMSTFFGLKFQMDETDSKYRS